MSWAGFIMEARGLWSGAPGSYLCLYLAQKVARSEAIGSWLLPVTSSHLGPSFRGTGMSISGWGWPGWPGHGSCGLCCVVTAR